MGRKCAYRCKVTSCLPQQLSKRRPRENTASVPSLTGEGPCARLCHGAQQRGWTMIVAFAPSLAAMRATRRGSMSVLHLPPRVHPWSLPMLRQTKEPLGYSRGRTGRSDVASSGCTFPQCSRARAGRERSCHATPGTTRDAREWSASDRAPSNARRAAQDHNVTGVVRLPRGEEHSKEER